MHFVEKKLVDMTYSLRGGTRAIKDFYGEITLIEESE